MSRFTQEDADKLMVACHRRCCICHRFCGVKMEIDHIIQAADDGSADIANGIAVCFECHADIHSYNDHHPRGRKFHPDELRLHKEQWLKICGSQLEIFHLVPITSGVGPLQSLIDELEFNVAVAQHISADLQGCLFMDDQFRKAIDAGAIAIVKDDLKHSLIEAYRVIGRANQHIKGIMHHQVNSEGWATAVQRASKSIHEVSAPLVTARNALLEFLRSER
jgi:HNH endonuclease